MVWSHDLWREAGKSGGKHPFFFGWNGQPFNSPITSTNLERLIYAWTAPEPAREWALGIPEVTQNVVGGPRVFVGTGVNPAWALLK